MKLEQKRKVRVTELWILLPLWLWQAHEQLLILPHMTVSRTAHSDACQSEPVRSGGSFSFSAREEMCPILTLLQSCGSYPQEKSGLGLHLGSRMGYLPCHIVVPLGQSKRLLLLMNVSFHSDFILSEQFCWILTVLPGCPSLTLTLWWLLSQIAW